jgi:hypothetical protein
MHMPLDICSLTEWKRSSSHWSQVRGLGHSRLGQIDDALQAYHLIPKQMIGERMRALDKIVAVTDEYRQNKATGSIVAFVQTRREKKVAAAEALYGQAKAKGTYLQAVQEAELSLPSLFGAGAKTPTKTSSNVQWTPLAHEILGLQKYIGPPDSGRVLHESYWTEAIDPLHRNWEHPTNSPIFSEWLKLRHEDKTTTLSFYRWFETLTDQDLMRLTKNQPLLATAYQDDIGREEFRVYVGGASHKLRKLTSPDTLADFSTAPYHTNFAGNGWCIFVISPEGKLYANNHDDSKGWFHAAFLGGKPVMAAGELFAKNGVLYAMTPKSGHYKPRAEDLIAGLKELRRQGLDLSETQVMVFKFDNNGKGMIAKGGGTLCEWYDAEDYINSNGDGSRGLLRTEGIQRSYRSVWNPKTGKPELINGDEWINKDRFRGWIHPTT